MTPDEHNKERMRAWTAFRSACGPCDLADKALAEFDKRFPAPAAVEVAPALPKAIASTWPAPDKRTLMEWTDHLQKKELHLDQREALLADELAALREKARLWDAVASGKVQLRNCTEGYWAWFGDGKDASKVTDTYSTAAEAVQAAIDAGALK